MFKKIYKAIMTTFNLLNLNELKQNINCELIARLTN